eukprot:CAMPEP_0119109010 /NCGR_PEP_ID=MMETSP1180-20130426/16759_1 /TAXON_ID=3052 ORGANISM="Chlamydomonas cf sp, Strain CCMP681" /NCGR_SAMPLE_ID=MMETSP1180 /ASSEMBLY_ACC=CAM_ASM_000741 /LENGTH=217 /DNA_ID=CAMNT_0007094703 /DNA_START=119 /DNA_END=772 /DNA_ORIENTATION=+
MAAQAAEVVRGYLVLTVEEASGRMQGTQGKEVPFCWDTTSQTGPFEAFAKIELRGGPRNVKALTRKATLVGDTLTWQEELRLEVLEGSNELRLMLCREKLSAGKRGTAVIAACGIYVSDILDAVPIDKYFELFKPNAGGDGGYIRISMNFVKDLPEKKVPAVGTAVSPAAVSKQLAAVKKGSSAGKVLRTLFTLSVLAALAGSITGVVLRQRKKSRE